MILGIGTDIVDIRRIEKLLSDQFIARCFTDVERTYCEGKRAGAGHVAAYARRFAAKEACAKALGCGIGHKAFLQDIEVTHDEQGRPLLTLSGAAHDTAQALSGAGYRLHLSLSDDPPYAVAYVVIERKLSAMSG